MDLFYKTIGLTPNTLAKAQEKKHTLDALNQQGRDNQNINFKIAKRLVDGDKSGAREMLIESLRSGIEPNPTAIMNYVERVKNPDIGELKRLPKKQRIEGAKVIRSFRDQ